MEIYLHVCVCMCVCANLFDIVNTGQHPDASVVEDGEFFCQFLLAGLDHSPRHLARCVRLQQKNSPNWIQKKNKNKKYHKSPVKWNEAAVIYGVRFLDFAHVRIASCTPPLRLPACFFFSVTGMKELSWFSQRGWLLLRSRTPGNSKNSLLLKLWCKYPLVVLWHRNISNHLQYFMRGDLLNVI